jgi:hypothetical protein
MFAATASGALLVELNGGNNPGDPDTWVNVAPGGSGGIGGEYSFEPNKGSSINGGPPEQMSQGPLTYYTASPTNGANGAWGRMPIGGGFPGTTGNEPPLQIADFTLEIWLRRLGDMIGSEQMIMALLGGFEHSSYPEDPIDQTFAIYTQRDNSDTNDADGHLDIIFQGSFDNESDQRVDILPVPITTNFHQWVFAWNNTSNNLAIYQSSVLQTNLNFPNTTMLGSALMDNTSIFKARTENTDSRRFNGDIALVRIYDEVIDQSVIDANFAAGANAGVPPPAGPALTLAPQSVARLVFESLPVDDYRLQHTSDVVLGNWVSAPEILLGTGDPMTVFGPNGSSPQTAYRLIVLSN